LFAPNLNDSLVATFFIEQTALVLFADEFDFGFGLFNVFLFDIRHNHVENADRNAATGRITVTQCFDFVEDDCSFCDAMGADTALDDYTEFFLAGEEITFQLEFILGLAAVNVAQILRNDVVENDTAQGRINDSVFFDAIFHQDAADFDLGMQLQLAFIVGHDGFFNGGEGLALTFGTSLAMVR